LRRFLTEVLGPQAWPTLFLWHHQVALDGLAAPEPVPGLLQGILDQCRQALLNRGRGEECFLEPLQARLDARENPAQVARRAYTDGGMAGLVAHARIPVVGG
ncbi:MAG: hypothetical protein QGG40_19215, partial [Myxococcota bacterium]|nr:hypothetical protein [Myxococcota bacterium]